MGSRIISKNARSLNGFKIANTIPTDGQILAYQSSSLSYIPSNASGGGNISNADLTQTDLNRVYTRSATSGVSRLRFQGVSQVLTLEDAMKLELYAGKYDDASFNKAIELSISGATGNIKFSNGKTLIEGANTDLNLYGQFATGLQSKIQLGANINIEAKVNRTLTLKTGTLYFDNTAGLVGSVKSDVFIWGSSYNAIGSEGFSVQKDMLVKGSDNSANTTGFQVRDVNNNSLLDIRNNGQTAWGGNRVVNTAHAFYNISGSSASLATFYESNGNIGMYLGTNGFLSTGQSGTTVFKTYRQSGFSHIQLFNGATQIVELQNADCYIAGTSLTVGSTTGVSGAKFTIQNASTNVSQQLFFGNVRTTTAGRLGSSGSFGTDQKGLECFDTTANKKFVWNGTAWEKIKGNIESVSVASATTVTPNIDISEMEIVSALSSALTIAVPTGVASSFYEGKELTFRIKDNGTARALTWNAIFTDYTGSLPTTTVANKTVYIGCKYNVVDTKWDVVAVQVQP